MESDGDLKWSIGRMIAVKHLGTAFAIAVTSLCIAQTLNAQNQEDVDTPVQTQEGGRLETNSDSETLRKALEMLAEEDLGLESPSDRDEPAVDQTTQEDEDQSIFADRETSVVGGRLTLPPIAASTTSTAKIGNGRLPLGYRGGADSPSIALPETGEQRGLPWQWQQTTWVASGSFSHPLYFEDRMLERHGHQRFPALQPMISGGRFIAQWVALPYLSTLAPPSECDYTLGYYRAGSCAPVLRQRAPWSRKAAAAQATSVAGGFLALP
ncbi:MAG: hypothetical protein AAFU85_27375 [Planctomycetota bacterium]